jgi:hypothetical protein
MPSRSDIARARLQLETPISGDEDLLKLQDTVLEYLNEAKRRDPAEPNESAPPDCHQQGIGDQLGRHAGAHRPADYPAREQIDDGRHVEPALRGPCLHRRVFPVLHLYPIRRHARAIRTIPTLRNQSLSPMSQAARNNSAPIWLPNWTRNYSRLESKAASVAAPEVDLHQVSRK